MVDNSIQTLTYILHEEIPKEDNIPIHMSKQGIPRKEKEGFRHRQGRKQNLALHLTLMKNEFVNLDFRTWLIKIAITRETRWSSKLTQGNKFGIDKGEVDRKSVV